MPEAPERNQKYSLEELDRWTLRNWYVCSRLLRLQGWLYLTLGFTLMIFFRCTSDPLRGQLAGVWLMVLALLLYGGRRNGSRWAAGTALLVLTVILARALLPAWREAGPWFLAVAIPWLMVLAAGLAGLSCTPLFGPERVSSRQLRTAWRSRRAGLNLPDDRLPERDEWPAFLEYPLIAALWLLNLPAALAMFH